MSQSSQMKSKRRGIANRGPIVKYIIIKNITENLGDILFNEPTYPCLSNAPTITPNNGKPIPVKQNAITRPKEMTTILA